jgi:hypothetical protein
MLDDLTGAYNALHIGKMPRLPLVRMQYPDFAAWQAKQLQNTSVQRQVLSSSALSLAKMVYAHHT